MFISIFWICQLIALTFGQKIGHPKNDGHCEAQVLFLRLLVLSLAKDGNLRT